MPKHRRQAAPPVRHRSSCPIAGPLDLLGDRWTLVVVRDLFRGRRHFSEFEASPEGISSNILADRLRRLEEAGLVRREAYQQHPLRFAYALTPKGAELKPILAALAGWAMRHLPGVKPDPALVAALGG